MKHIVLIYYYYSYWQHTNLCNTMGTTEYNLICNIKFNADVSFRSLSIKSRII